MPKQRKQKKQISSNDYLNPNNIMKQLNNFLKAFSTKSLMLLFFFTLLPTFASAQCPDNNHPHMIDLGLPSGTKWACCNVGAEKPEDYGGYYAWGETEEKENYDWSTYIHYDSSSSTCHDIGSDIAGTQYDAATANWGSPWVMPNREQQRELFLNCTQEWTTENGIKGIRFTGPNGASIFLADAGYRWEGGLHNHSCYWFSSSEWSEGLVYADVMTFEDGKAWEGANLRYRGQPVRPVVAGSSTPSGIAIDENNFPDENFRNWVLSQDYGQDGVLTEAEIAGVTEIYVPSQNIASLKGIEYFTALQQLYCGNNKITTLDVSQNMALWFLLCESNQLTTLDVSQNTALGFLYCDNNKITTLDVSQNTALTQLNCYNNLLTSLDVSQNTALKGLGCGANLLTSLDVSKNTALTSLACSFNQLTSLDVSQNTALTFLDCHDNQLTSLDVSQNKALTTLSCSSNQLTSLDVSKNTALTSLACYGNQINEAEMGNLVESLPANNGELRVKDLNYAGEQNVITTKQVTAAKAKGWKVYAYDENVGDWGDWVEYDGDEPQEITPVEQGETIDIGTEIDENTDLDGNVVGDVYYCISSGDGSYDPEEGCLVVTKPTDDSAIDGKDIFGEDFKDNYAGFMFMVAPGKGSIKVEAQTIGNMVLKVKVGDNAPTQMEVNGKTKVSFSYDVSEPTMVLIYGSIGAAGAKGMRKASSTDALKIYGIEVTSETNGIEAIDNGQLTIDNSPVYNLNGQRVESSKLNVQSSKLPKGIYIQNGKKVLVK